MVKKAAFALLMLACAGLFTALGIWQVERLAWKRALIAQTEAKLAAAPIATPAPAAWPEIGSKDVYTRVTATGTYMPGKDTFVLASTQYGRGAWVMTPLKTDTNFTVLVNRGFVTHAQEALITPPSGTVVVHGLLRVSEPKGSWLQHNQPAEDRWYSRDVGAIAARRGLTDAAPYFIDADAEGSGLPVGGLTVVHFWNHHLQYALTWFGLALLCFGGLVVLFWQPRR